MISRSRSSSISFTLSTPCTKGCSGTLTDVRYWSFHPHHRTTLSHFFTKSPWNEENRLEKLQEWILRQIERLAKRENQPLFLSMDDPICQKTKPSSRATHAIQGCDWPFSHSDHQWVWGHSLVWLMVHTFSQAFPFAFRLYDKTAGRSKIVLAIEMLSSLKEKWTRPMCMVSVPSAHRSLLETRIPCHRHAQDEPDPLSERHRHSSEGVCPLYRTQRHPPRHGGGTSVTACISQEIDFGGNGTFHSLVGLHFTVMAGRVSEIPHICDKITIIKQDYFTFSSVKRLILYTSSQRTSISS
ncbi:hypothetical protein EP10_002323 [Geobacillus icigianus]|uniref:Transposase IS701-like DDE domain-containing protein n=1 Tax=Geobacillus icigianus TaxID=1430331 RepID=A0ABU6BHQ1_9BACL|nr:hypothetical protein [Geobacillus icigianus]